MKKYVHLTFVLFVISLLSGLIVGGVYFSLKPTIAKVEQERVDKATISIFGDGYKAGNGLTDIKDDRIDSIYPAVNAEGEEDGYVIKLNAPKSYSGTLYILVGITNEGKVKDIAYLNMQETSGIGTRVKGEEEADAWYKEQFAGYTGDTELDTISGATYSSKAVVTGVDIALDYYKNNLDQ